VIQQMKAYYVIKWLKIWNLNSRKIGVLDLSKGCMGI